jgi:hypothetical protein
MKVRHIYTHEVFAVQDLTEWLPDGSIANVGPNGVKVLDDHGEMRWFQTYVLEPWGGNE